MILQKLPIDDIPEGHTICIYGTGKRGKWVHEQISTNRPDITIACYADTYQSGTLDEKPIYSFEQINEVFNTVDSIAIASTHALEIFNSLACYLEDSTVSAYGVSDGFYKSYSGSADFLNTLNSVTHEGLSPEAIPFKTVTEQHGEAAVRKILIDYFSNNTGANLLTSNPVNDAIIPYLEEAKDEKAAFLLLYRMHLAQGNWEPARAMTDKVNALFAETREVGTPHPGNIIVSSLPKSGTVFMKRCFSYLYGLKIRDISSSAKLLFSFNNYRVNPDAVHNFFQSPSVCVDHIPYKNMPVLIENAPDGFKIVVHLRDPRQHLLSLFMMFEQHLNTQYNLLNRDIYCYFDMDWRDYAQLDQSQKLDLYIDKALPCALDFIGEWVRNGQEHENVMFTFYDRDFHDDNQKLVRMVADFYGLPFNETHQVMIKKPKTGQLNFRKGCKEQWRSVFSPEQQKRMWTMIPDDIKTFMNLNEF